MVYYNEIDPKAVAWLWELIEAGVIAEGVVDSRSIKDVEASDLEDFDQCHFFAGIGVWSYALRLAGWPDDRKVWTGSCPCQPFSNSGRKKGFTDDRHLWPAWRPLIAQCRPPVVFGEQVASALAWDDLVQGDLEAEGYARGSVIVGAHSVGAPHIRQRLYWVADDDGAARDEGRAVGARSYQGGHATARAGSLGSSDAHGLAVTKHTNWRTPGVYRENECDRQDDRRAQTQCEPRTCNKVRVVGESDRPREHAPVQRHELRWLSENRFESVGAGPLGGFWGDAEWLGCADDKLRPVEPGTFPLAHGAPARVGRLRGYGNAIVAPLATEFIGAYMDTVDAR